MLIKISVYLPSHLTWWGETSDRTILEQPSPKRLRDFRLKSRARCSEYVTQVLQKTSRVCIHQWAHTHLLIVFRSGTASTLAPCGSLLNLMIYTQAHQRCLETVCLTGCPISMETPDFQLLACQWAFVLSIIPRNDNSNFSSHRFSLICNKNGHKSYSMVLAYCTFEFKWLSLKL